MTYRNGRALSTAVAAAVVTLSSACNPDTFASGSDAAEASITNDNATSIELRLCSDNACANEFSPPRYELEAGESVRVNVSKRGVPNVYLVLDDGGERTGCLPIVVDDPDAAWARVDVAVSMQVTCSDDLPSVWPTP